MLVTRTNATRPQRTNSFNWLFDDFFSRDILPPTVTQKATRPLVNIQETEQSFELWLQTPGFKKEQFDLKMEDNLLTISGNTKIEKEAKTEKFSRKEFGLSNFSRSFTLPENADKSSITATYEDGILCVSIQKIAAPEKPAAVKIEVK